MKKLFQILMILMPFFMTACVDVVLYDGHDINYARIVPEFDFGEHDNIKPLRMQILASRIINTHRFHSLVWSGEPVIDSLESIYDDSLINEGPVHEGLAFKTEKDFCVYAGNYTILALSKNDSLEFDNLHEYLTDYSLSIKTLQAHVKSVSTKQIFGDEDSICQLAKFNSGYDYIDNLKDPVFLDAKKNVTINTGDNIHMPFSPRLLTQAIHMNFNIKYKDNIKIKKVIAEMSGVCSKVQVLTGKLNTDHFYRTAFSLTEDNGGITNEASGEGEGTIKCNGTFNVFGLLSEPDGTNASNVMTGRGILHVAIFVESDGVERVIYAGYNCKKIIDEKHLTVENDDGAFLVNHEATIDIKLPFNIDKDVVEQAKNDNLMLWKENKEEENIDTEV